MFLVGSAARVVESIGPLNITTLGRRGPDLGTVRAPAPRPAVAPQEIGTTKPNGIRSTSSSANSTIV